MQVIGAFVRVSGSERHGYMYEPTSYSPGSRVGDEFMVDSSNYFPASRIGGEFLVDSYSYSATTKHLRCEYCAKRYSSLSTLKRHVMLHSEGTLYRFECHLCGKKYTRRDQLNVHILTHPGQSPYECDVCGLKFRSHTNRTKHFNSVHLQQI